MRLLAFVRNTVAELFAWIGIIGGCLTLFGAFAAVMPLAPWAKAVIEAWHAAPPANGSVDPAWVGVKSFAFFTIPLALGLRLKVVRWREGWRPIYVSVLLGVSHWLYTFSYMIYAIIGFYVSAVLIFALQSAKLISLSDHNGTLLSVAILYVGVVMAIIHHQATVNGSSWAIGMGTTAFMLLAYTILAVFPRLALKGTWDEFMNSFGFFGLVTMPLLVLAPPRALLRRLAVLSAGLFVLLGANAASNG